MKDLFRSGVLIWALSVASVAQAQHLCDTAPSPTVSVSAGKPTTVTACWNGMSTDTPPKAVTGATWKLVVDGAKTTITMVKSGAASTKGEYLYTGTGAGLSAGVHQVTIEVSDTAGGAALALPGPVTVSVSAVPNLPPTVNAGPNLNVVANVGTPLLGIMTDDGLPTTILTGNSPNGWRVPRDGPSAQTAAGTWTIGPSYEILLNGTLADGGYGSVLLVWNGEFYALGGDGSPGGEWWRKIPGTWEWSSATDPSNGYLVPPIKAPLTQVWSKTSGPGTVTFSAPTALITNATFSAAGTYIIRLTGSDGAASAFDEATVVVTGGVIPPTTLVVTKATTTCNLVATATPPTTETGWRFQARYGTASVTSNLGSSDTTAPYVGSAAVAAGKYQVAGVWTRSGSSTVTLPTQTVVCP